MSFADMLTHYAPEKVAAKLQQQTSRQVEQALSRPRKGLDDLLALLSPAAEPYLEPMAQQAHALTQQRFGNTILMFAPLYLSNVCCNSCAYCGFKHSNPIPRHSLSPQEAEEEARMLAQQGFQHLLLLTGEAPQQYGVDQLEEAIVRIKPHVSSISLEVFPMDQGDYERLLRAGVDGLTVYQETYNQQLYATLHPSGPKRDYFYRLGTPERAAAAGLRRIGIGALLGLDAPRQEAFYVGLHAHYLATRYWRSLVTVSFPRLRPAEGGFQPRYEVADKMLVQMLCSLRLLLPDAGMVLSTREGAQLRDHLLPLGITQMSAGSCTAPGGYSHKTDASAQFDVDDKRSPQEVARMLAQQGYEPVWKDWDTAFLDTKAS